MEHVVIVQVITGVDFNYTAAMQGAHHILHLILPKCHLVNDRLSRPLRGCGKRSHFLLLFTPVMLPLLYGSPTNE